MESLISAYISHELVSEPEFLPLKNDTPLLESGILDSLSILMLAQFLERQFGVVVRQKELVRKNFMTIDAICAYLRSKPECKRSDN